MTGGIIVTGPQTVSVADARRGLAAFNRLEVPVLGVIENMSGDIFGRGGGVLVAEELGVDFLGAIDLHPDIPSGGDAGKPFVIAHPEDEISGMFQQGRILSQSLPVLKAIMHLLGLCDVHVLPPFSPVDSQTLEEIRKLMPRLKTLMNERLDPIPKTDKVRGERIQDIPKRVG